MYKVWKISYIGGSKAGAGDAPNPILFNFMEIQKKMAKILGWRPPSLGNPESATDYLVEISQLLPYKFRGILLIQVSVFALSLDATGNANKV